MRRSWLFINETQPAGEAAVPYSQPEGKPSAQRTERTTYMQSVLKPICVSAVCTDERAHRNLDPTEQIGVNYTELSKAS